MILEVVFSRFITLFSVKETIGYDVIFSISNYLAKHLFKMGLHHWQCRDGGAQYKKNKKRKRFRDRRATFTTVYVVGW
jgi:hypothetical protein